MDARNIVRLLLVFIVVGFSSQSFAKIKLYYAGVAYMGDYSAKDKLYKYSSQIIDESNELDTALRQRIEQVENDSVDILVGAHLVDYGKDDALTMAFALQNENISIENIGGVYKIDIDLRANILVFDFNNMTIIASYPISIQLRDSSNTKPSGSELKNIIRNLYLGDSGVNIFDSFIERLSALDVKRSFSNTVKVRNVLLRDDAKKNMPGINEQRAEEDYKTYLAQIFSTYLSKNQNMSVLPYSKGHAIGYKMPLKISNAKVYNLSIPGETYSIDIDLRKLKKANIGENDYIKRWAYGTYMGIKLLIPDSDVIYMDAKFRKLVKKDVSSRTNHTVNDWSIYQESIYRFFDEFTKNISDTDSGWLNGVTRTENISEQFERFNEKIISCK